MTTTTTPPTHASPVEHIRQLARDGFPWTAAAETLGFGLLMAESFATLTHLTTQMSCQWLAQPVARRASKLQEQLDQLRRQWFTLNPQATPDHLAQLAELFTAWSQGNAEAQAEMTRKLKALMETRPSATLLQLWGRQLRQARQPSFETYFQALRRKRPGMVPMSPARPLQPLLPTPAPVPAIPQARHDVIDAPLKGDTWAHQGATKTPAKAAPGKPTRHGGNASQRFQALMGLQT